MSAETGLELTADHIAYLLDRKLAPLGITTDSNGSRPTIASPQPFLSLRFKRALLPSSATWFLGGLFSWLFHPLVIVVAVTAALVSEIWLFGSEPMASALAQALADPTSVLLVGGLAVTSAFFHEIGHASACRFGGVRPGSMGCGVYLVWPVFYTDIGNTYRLDRWGRLRAVLGGVYFNAIFIIGLTVLYLWTGYPALLAAIVIVNLELAQQLLPTLRFDGYYIVSDLVGIPDLFKYIGPILKRTVLRQPADERLRALKTWPQRVVTVWVLVVIPALVAQLSFVAFQMPQFVDIAWQRVITTLSGTDAVGIAGDIAYTMLALLPLAGLLVVVLQAARGVTNILRLNVQSDGGGAPDVTPGAQGQLSDAPPPRGWHSRTPAAKYLLGFNAILLMVGLAYIVSGRGMSSTDPASPPPSGKTSTESGQSARSRPTTTTTIAVPAGDDAIVRSVIDGDSFEVTSGDKVRLIGIDAPDIEAEHCFSAEAKAALAEVLAPGTTVRLVYEANRFDQLGRTLADVYRLPDGLFVNLALARDGFAFQASTQSRTTRAVELNAAVIEARDAGRGLWSSCPTRSSRTGTNPAASGASRETTNRNRAPSNRPTPTTAPPATTPPVTSTPDSTDDSGLVDKLLGWLLGSE